MKALSKILFILMFLKKPSSLPVFFLGPVFLGFVSGCPRRTPNLAQIERNLMFPPGESTLKQIKTMAEHEAGVQASLLRLHYLLDLFDYARFMDHELSRTVLLENLKIFFQPPENGEKTTLITGMVLDELKQATVALLNRVRSSGTNQNLVKDLSDLETLLGWDRDFSKTEDQRLEHVNFLKRLGAVPGPLRVNALLRLYGWCAQSLRAMIIAPEGKRQKAANFCLYVVSEHDPRSYVSEQACRLPAPNPLQLHLMNKLTLEQIAAETGEPLAEALVPVLKKRWKHEYVVLKKKTSLWTRSLDSKTDLVTVNFASPRYESPLVLVEEEKIQAADRVVTRPTDRNLRPLLTWLYSRSERKHLALRVSPSIPWHRIWAVLQAAVRSGFESAGFQVLTPLKNEELQKTPPFSETMLTERASGLRLAEIPLSMLVIAPWPVTEKKTYIPPVEWTDACTSRWVTLEISPRQLRISARGGACSPPIELKRDQSKDYKAEENETGISASIIKLQKMLLEVKKTFPDECGLMVTVSGTTPFHLLARVLSAARKTPEGKTLFELQALRISPGSCNEEVPFPDGIGVQPSKPNEQVFPFEPGGRIFPTPRIRSPHPRYHAGYRKLLKQSRRFPQAYQRSCPLLFP